MAYAHKVNREIISIIDSIIDFSNPHQPMIPHITILMGRVYDDMIMIQNITEKILPVLESYSQFEFEVTPPYIEPVNEQYIFDNVNLNTKYYDFQEELISALDPMTLKIEKEYIKSTHLTLGYIDSKQGEVSRMLEKGYQSLSIKSFSNFIELSDTGRKGTCVNSLTTYIL